MSEKDGGPAFPQSCDSMGKWASAPTGMSLRDWFAGQLMVGMVYHTAGQKAEEAYAKAAYRIADAMLKAREVKPHE